MADLFDVIADPTRRELLRALLVHAGTGAAGRRGAGEVSVGEVSVGELVGELSLSQPTVSKHLRTLRDFSLVAVREQGQHRYYRLDAEQLRPIAEWLGPFLPPPIAVPAEPAAEGAAVQPAPIQPAPMLPLPIRNAALRIGSVAAGVFDRIPARNR